MAIKKTAKANEEIKMEVVEKCGVISKGNNGWTTELRYVKWGDNAAKYDLRPWKTKDDGTEICGKGITLTGEELETLGNIIKGMED